MMGFEGLNPSYALVISVSTLRERVRTHQAPDGIERVELSVKRVAHLSESDMRVLFILTSPPGIAPITRACCEKFKGPNAIGAADVFAG